MIDEKKLIEDMMNNDGIDFRMDFNTDTEDSVLESLREFAAVFAEGVRECQLDIQNLISTEFLEIVTKN